MIKEKPVVWEPILSKGVMKHVIGFEEWITDNFNKYHKK